MDVSNRLKRPAFIVQAASFVGCFGGMYLVFPICYLIGIDPDECITSLTGIIVLMALLVSMTLVGYYLFSYGAAYLLVYFKVICKKDIPKLGIGGFASKSSI
ncbi:hypothetical protein [Vibrio paracholerae]|uniref:hypothetical protein n=1 Tax=Vibrio paracholerae TaxID=650003 RepID=UPI000510E641|nr:hypothetical protein [Vibrio paracholerae]